jgi:hypothetical protein
VLFPRRAGEVMSWADTHIVVMGMDNETNEKIKEAIKQRLEGKGKE